MTPFEEIRNAVLRMGHAIANLKAEIQVLHTSGAGTMLDPLHHAANVLTENHDALRLQVDALAGTTGPVAPENMTGTDVASPAVPEDETAEPAEETNAPADEGTDK